jgi:hypothetical protein
MNAKAAQSSLAAIGPLNDSRQEISNNNQNDITMSLINKILSAIGSTPAALAELRQVEIQNEQDRAWKKSISAEILALEAAREEAGARLSKDPSQDNLDAFIEATIAAGGTRYSALTQVERMINDSFHLRLVERSKPALKNALKSILSLLEGKKAEVVAKEQALSSEIGIADSVPENSASVQALNAKIQQAESYLSRIDKLDRNTYKPAVAFALGN